MLKPILTATAVGLVLAMSSVAQAASPTKVPADGDTRGANAPSAAPANPAYQTAPVEKIAPSDQSAVPLTREAPADQAANPSSENEQIAVLPAEGVTQFRAKDALGAKVLDSGGADVGRVSDLVLNEDGRLAAIVVNVGGLLGIGGKDVAVAANKARLISDETGKVVELDVSKADLHEAPKFKTQDELKSEIESHPKSD